MSKDTMSNWSKGSVTILLGCASDDSRLVLQGLKMIHEQGHEMAAPLVTILDKTLRQDGIIEPYQPESKERILDLIPDWIEAFEEVVEDGRAVDALLAEISKNHN